MTQYCNENLSMSTLLPAVGPQKTVDNVITHQRSKWNRTKATLESLRMDFICV